MVVLEENRGGPTATNTYILRGIATNDDINEYFKVTVDGHSEEYVKMIAVDTVELYFHNLGHDVVVEFTATQREIIEHDTIERVINKLANAQTSLTGQQLSDALYGGKFGGYEQEKFYQFQSNPVRYYTTLDMELRRDFIELIEKM